MTENLETHFWTDYHPFGYVFTSDAGVATVYAVNGLADKGNAVFEHKDGGQTEDIREALPILQAYAKWDGTFEFETLVTLDFSSPQEVADFGRFLKDLAEHLMEYFPEQQGKWL